MGKKADKDLSNTPIIIADVNDEKSLVEMAKKAKIIVNCCGPYRHWGEQVVKACIEAGTHHVDVSGEPQYMETMQLKYNEQAREKGVYIVSACGYDSIPAEIGTVFLQDNFQGTVNSVEAIVYHYQVDKTKPRAGANFGTLASIVHAFANMNELPEIRRKLYPIRTPRLSPALEDRGIIHQSEVAENRWCLPFPEPDRSVMMRSQRHFLDKESRRPAQVRVYMAFESFLHATGAAFGFLIFGLLMKFQFTRNLILKYPEICTLGIFSRTGPNEEGSENMKFEMTFYGEGWKEKLAEPTDEFTFPINKKMTTKFTAVNPGYGATCIALLVSASTILKESSKMPDNGGVFPPGAAFKNTNIVQELKKNGFTFEVLKVEE